MDITKIAAQPISGLAKLCLVFIAHFVKNGVFPNKSKLKNWCHNYKLEDINVALQLLQRDGYIYNVEDKFLVNTDADETTLADTFSKIGIDTLLPPLEYCKENNIAIHITRHVAPDGYAQSIMARWNEMAEKLPRIKPVSALTTARQRNISGNWYDVEAVIKEIEQSPLLKGEVNQWCVTFDWTLTKDNYAKILEGKYRGGTTKKQNSDVDW